MREELEAVWAGFANPPDEARPRAWWHWMDGNVDPAGIRLDLQWLHDVGVRGVQMFDGGMGTPLVVPEKVRFGSAEWREALHLAKATARRLGLEFAVATSPGWSAAGAPWVTPADAMKKVEGAHRLGAGPRLPVDVGGDRIDRSVPAGFGFDYVNLDGLEECLTVDDGMIVARGARYRVLYLGGSSHRMTLRALGRIRALLNEGATIIGPRPGSSPSLIDDPVEHTRAVRSLWDAGEHKGRLIDIGDLARALGELGLVPSRTVEGAGLIWTSRRIRDTELTFLANTKPEPVPATVRATTPLVSWNPVTVRQEALPAVSRLASGEYEYRFDLSPLESVVLVEDDGERLPARSAAPGAELRIAGAWELRLPGRAAIRLEHGPVPWTELGEEGFAGVGAYAGTVDVDPAFLRDRRILVAFGDVGDIARVLVNEADSEIIWTAPFEADITGALRPGRNTVVVEVANTWMNRLIAEARHPTGEIFAPVADVYEPYAEIRPAGLSGPVVLRAYAP